MSGRAPADQGLFFGVALVVGALMSPQHLKAQICRELDRLELLLQQIKVVDAERDARLDAEQTKASAPPPMLLGVPGVGPEFASVLWSEGLSRHFDNRRQVAGLCGPCPDALAKRVGQSRAGHLEIGQPATTDNDDSVRLALATPSATLGTYPLVQGPNGT
jgi:transposase